MGWAVGEDLERRRHIGYGVPATCDQPGCNEGIDRGLAYACGGGIPSKVTNCGLFFCGEHLSHFREDNDPDGGGEWVCERCADGLPPFAPSPDTVEWAQHVLTDPSWAKFRGEQPSWVMRYQQIVSDAPQTAGPSRG